MKPYYSHAGITIYHGDARHILPQLENGCAAMMFTDPPYLREFLETEDSPARTSATPASAPELPDPVRGCGGRWCVAFAWYDRSTSSWRTWQRCFVEGWARYLETWPRSVMTRGRIVFRPQTLEPLTLEDEYGLLPTKFPTPSRMDSNRGDYTLDNGNPNKRRLSLRGTAKLWPTPRSEDSQCAGNHPDKTDSLHAAVKLWPTPQKHDAVPGNAARVGRHGTKHGDRNLNDFVQMWPTPTPSGQFQSLTREMFRTPQKRDWKGQTSEKWATRDNGDNTPSLADQVGGQLNPTWVEWLMGYPAEWTVLRHSATPSSRSARRKQSAVSSKNPSL